MNTIIKPIRTISLLLLGIAFSGGAYAQQTLSLKDALNYAIQNSVTVRKAKLDIDGGKFKTQEIRAQALPQITGNASLTDNLILQSIVLPGEFLGKPGEVAILQAGTKYNAGAGVQLNQQLFNQTVFTGLKAAKSSERYYSLNAELTEEQIIEQVANNYYSVLVNRQQLNVLDTNIKNVKVVENIIANQYQNGLAKKIDVDRIKVNLTNLQTQREQTVNAIVQLENQLKFSMGMPVETAIVIPADQLTEVRSLPEMANAIDLENRTELKLANVQKDLYTLDRKAKVSEYYPTLALNSNYNYTGVSNKFDLFKGGNNTTANWYDMAAIGITLKIPIFDGFATRSRVRQADVNLRKADEDIRQTKNSLNLAYENAKIVLRNNMNTITAQRQNVILAQEIYQSTQNNYNNGLAALTDLLDTENALTQAQNSYNQALLNYKIAEIQLIKSNGNIKSLLQ
ncbi:TolC family protein [Pedobacter metabolipauper]|uniref:Outer membrane protein TolC n=1 Tax=Pedobacter metabolipauper TaxID=425513 RepID=A0A4R6SXN2_9SPHI|nr:TolC family protein [Pedobacter metabolipauper]TDQ10251.1 outer membrane protein TolC [Pedobacter metabolipauper]